MFLGEPVIYTVRKDNYIYEASTVEALISQILTPQTSEETQTDEEQLPEPDPSPNPENTP